MAFISGFSINTNTSSVSARKCSRTAPAVNMFNQEFSVAAPTKQKVTIRVDEKGKVKDFEVQAGANLREALLENKVDVYTLGGKLRNCGGNGSCCLCTVKIVDGMDNLSPKGPKEEFVMSNKPEGYRLACRTTISGDISVVTKPQERK
mmetsp:Transcript_6950/g.12526  ORF Transcript_6950/g.12526 Transcript_6950/m.12526 type:complete len:148 (+) Transcript_6950:205-648(+)|eukprot:CAMPEP_0184697330 /NCGR_PEP_ID=MMETSP0313-20130426/4324_1 /TAXON_ID=2792 /ORGANISM="Porphyridium aerugineum, Strain SAG 1380-2" /LENGTH=147 /DNA_ID=CAMNT_0027156109 /DNA_START=150 /DNA_END=593 /DNA_ORIENTATION=+